jgi:hypothetical protein
MLALGALALTACTTGMAAGAENPIHTNESYVEDALRKPGFSIESIDEVLDYVFSSVADEVTVYPTENYYYFKFVHAGVPYAGNFRLDIADRDSGIIHFAYFTENTPHGEQRISQHRAYGAETGMAVEKKDDLTYAVTRNGRTVTFHLNDLRHVKPSEERIAPGETYIGPVFDEAAVQFFLMWNPELKQFLYILDEDVASEDYFETSASAQIRIGYRTGFAYYRDRYRDRWILVGVRAYDASLNTYLDGPFDQLPDNFIEGDTLRQALLALSPEVEGEIDRFGNSLDLTGRMLVDPYILYSDDAELAVFDQCAAAAVDEDTYYPCFAIGQSQ